MRPDKAGVLAREQRWALPVAIATLAGVVLVVAGFVIVQSAIGSGANFEGLEAVHEKPLSVAFSGTLNAVGFALLVAPLLYLFRAVQARSERVRAELVGLVAAAPLLLALSGVLLTVGTDQAATRFVDGTAKPTLSAGEAGAKCRSKLKEKGAKAFGEEFEATGGTTSLAVCRAQNLEEDRASNAIEGASAVTLARYVGLAGGLALVISLVYGCLWAMRTGLLTRFWGSLGMALGVAALFGFTSFTLIWFFYFGLLAAGWLPGGRPPAWAAGEAVPWPTPGEKAAEELGGGEEKPAAGQLEGPDADEPREPGGDRKPTRHS